MRSSIVIILLALKLRAHENQLVASRTRDMQELMDQVVVKLVNRAHKMWILHHVSLDNITTAKALPNTGLTARYSRPPLPDSSSRFSSLRSPMPFRHTPSISHARSSSVIRSTSNADSSAKATEADDEADQGASAGGVAGVAVAAAALAAGAAAGAPGGKHAEQSKPQKKKSSGAHKVSSRTGTVLPEVDKSTSRAFLKNLKTSDVYFKPTRKELKSSIDRLQQLSGSNLLRRIRQAGFKYTVGDVTFVLAESYGFCWGVERSVALAYEARNQFTDKNIWVTNEIIHNPDVNAKLHELGMRFILKDENGMKDFSVVEQGDVVVLPAFGATVEEMAYLKERNVEIVDTTCPWVGKVWYMIEKSKDVKHTAIIHGAHKHEETIATSSFADKYLIVRNMEEAEYVADYILNGDTNGPEERDAFLEKFKGRYSKGFDPDKDLKKVGVANQTTMLKGETQLIGRLFERIMIRRFGPQEINDHFVAFNTICDATDERQNAMYKMFGKKYQPPEAKLLKEIEASQAGIELLSDKSYSKLSSREKEAESRGAGVAADIGDLTIDVTLIVGGFNSANTAHLLEIADEQGIPGYHIDNVERIGLPGDELSTGIANQIESKPLSTPVKEAIAGKGLHVTKDFLPDGPVVIGVTSGASTPDSVVEECLLRILAVKGISQDEILSHIVEPPPVEESADATEPEPILIKSARPGTPKGVDKRELERSEGPVVPS